MPAVGIHRRRFVEPRRHPAVTGRKPAALRGSRWRAGLAASEAKDSSARTTTSRCRSASARPRCRS